MNIHQLLEYDAWATKQLLDAIQVLSPQQFVHEFGGELSSVRQQMVHLLTVADRYRVRLAGDEVPDIQPEEFATPQQLIAYENRMRQKLNDYAAVLNESEIIRVHDHATRRGPFRATTEETVWHIVNHATYHRGQVACLLKLHGVDFPDTDFIIWLNRDI
jgi:uncharacterized damage-inducible protein DinB